MPAPSSSWSVGYVPTTIDAIAERAGMSRRTVFTSVGSKADVLKLAFDWTLAGDDEPIAIADRPVVQRLMRADDPADVLQPWIAMNATINERIAPLYLVLVVAANADPDVATLLATSDAQRLDGARQVVGPGRRGGRPAARPQHRRSGSRPRRPDRPEELPTLRRDPRMDTRHLLRHLQAMATAAILR